MQDDYGFGYLGDGEQYVPEVQQGQSEAQRVFRDLDMRRPGMVESARMGEQVFAGSPAVKGLPPALRYPQNSVQIFPPRVIAPDPDLYPNLSERKEIARGEDTQSNAIQIRHAFSDKCTVYAISGWGYTSPGDVLTFGLNGFEIQFQKNGNLNMSTAPCFAPAIVGTAERPMPIATPGWYFDENQYMMIIGTADQDIWKLHICFHVSVHIPQTNLGMSRTTLYTADNDRLRQR